MNPNRFGAFAAFALALALSVPVLAGAGTASAASHDIRHTGGSAPSRTATGPAPQPAAASATTPLTTPVTVSAARSATASGTAPDGRGERLALLRPTGRHAVGRDTVHLTDQHRRDPWVPEAGARELMVSMYYPARAHSGGRAAYMTEEEARLLLEDREITAVSAATLSGTRTHARAGATPEPGRFPLVVLSPGFSVSRTTLTGLAEDLASRGYVVAAVDHAYESVGTAFPGGRMLKCAACDKIDTVGTAAAARWRATDLSFVLDRLTGPAPAWRYAHAIDPRRIGMAGHSMGGAGTAAAMAGDRRVRAGVTMDGPFAAPGPASGLDGRPFMMLGTASDHSPGKDPGWDQGWTRLDGWKRWLTVAGSGHFAFTDLPVLGAQLGLDDPSEPLPGRRAGEITRAYVGAFFDLHLRGIPQPLLTGPSPSNPEVSFHHP
ncbi:alpha/beta hydrolase [Streptomyces sp. MST-110588]|uniref:alpha/beta hydrolase family protein n=1 Tax=Streptomyces sp. MST-110588 TaxID=2833628 RepID=UPI001F5DDE03|nr:alpha/beta hydrolase [Streptomyces sp. MST-110588]UNO43245.1 alpha/beta hydrolase [Streptomyces sp. MST-110588]